MRKKVVNVIFSSIIMAVLGAFFAIVAVIIMLNPTEPLSFHQFKLDSTLGYEYLPNSHFSYVEKGRHSKIIHVYYDKYGARVPLANAVSATPSDFMIIGGSQAWGQGVLEDETFAGLLAKYLHASVVNLAVSSYGGVSSLLRLKRYINLFKPKYIVYGFWQDHINRNVIPCVEQPLPVCERRPVVSLDQNGDLIMLPSGNNEKAFKMVADWYATSRPGFWFDLQWKWQKFKWNFLKRIGHSPENNPLRTDAGKKTATIFVLRQMAAVAKNANAKLVVVFIPFYSGAHEYSMPHYIAKVAKNNNIILINMATKFLEMHKKNIKISIPDDGHMTPRAHAAIAKAIIKKIGYKKGANNFLTI